MATSFEAVLRRRAGSCLSAAFSLAIVARAAVACSSAPPVFDAGADAKDLDVDRDASAPPGDASTDAGTPYLAELAVTDGSAPVALVPSFSPDTHDYYVRCAAGGNSLTVRMSAGGDSKSLLVAPTSSPVERSQTVPIVVDEGHAIVAAAIAGDATVEYWVRCLPHDFPDLESKTYADAGTPAPGYYLMGNYAPIAGTGCYAMVLDSNAVPVWYYRADHGYLNDVDNPAPQTISFAHYTPVVEQNFELHHLRPSAITYVEPTDTVLDEHELRVLSNGHYLVIANPVKNGVDLTGVSVTLPDGGVQKFGPHSSIQDCNLVEFDPRTGEVSWKWRGTDHLDPAKDSTVSVVSYNAVTGPDGGLVLDPFHCNSIDVDTNGNLLVSARHMDSIFYVDHGTGAILWKMGGSEFTKDHAVYVTVPDAFYRQHDARLQPGWSPTCAGGSGQISLFDDETFRSEVARAVVYDVVVGGGDGGTPDCVGGRDGGEAGVATVAWQHKGVASSEGLGSFRIQADGSRVIGWGAGTPNPAFTVVDENHHELFEVSFADGNGSYRAVKVPKAALDLEAMRRDVGR